MKYKSVLVQFEELCCKRSGFGKLEGEHIAMHCGVLMYCPDTCKGLDLHAGYPDGLLSPIISLYI